MSTDDGPARAATIMVALAKANLVTKLRAELSQLNCTHHNGCSPCRCEEIGALLAKLEA